MFTLDRETKLRMSGWLVHLVGVTSVLGGFALYHLVVAALILHEQQQIAIETADKERYVARKDIVHEEFDQYTARLTELMNNAETMRQRIPEQPQEAEFLKQVSQVADEHGVKIIKYDRGSLQRKGTHCEFDVRLSCEGNYPAICAFLDRLARLSRVTTVQSLTLTSSQADTYPFELSLLLYYGTQGTPHNG